MGTQQSIDDPNDTFAPVVRASSMRLLFAIAGAQNWHAHVCDIDQAFLSSDINPKYDIYLHPPPQLDLQHPQSTLLRLSKALYGLKTSSKDFFLKLSGYFKSAGFSACKSDECVLYKILDVLVGCVGCPSGALLTNDNLINIFQACYRIGHFQTEKGRDTSGGCCPPGCCCLLAAA
jgi:hypothetical protein